MSVPAIELKNMQFSYAKEAEPILSIAHWKLDQGERVFLYGDSGSGKTTLLNLLCGIMVPSEGTLTLFGADVSEMSNRKRDKFRAQNIGVVFQRFNLIPYLTVAKNIELADYFAASKVNKRSDNALANHAKSLIEKLSLPSDILQSQVKNLSTGQQQRVAIARALINKPKLLLVDEPTSALDASARDAFMKVLMDMCEEANTTLIFVSHDSALSSYFEHKVEIQSLNSTGNAVAV